MNSYEPTSFHFIEIPQISIYDIRKLQLDIYGTIWQVEQLRFHQEYYFYVNNHLRIYQLCNERTWCLKTLISYLGVLGNPKNTHSSIVGLERLREIELLVASNLHQACSPSF